MCTVSWCRHADGYELFFNRDERNERAAAAPPVVSLRSGIPVLAPRDGDHGGTWLAVNAAGLMLGMLNHYPAGAPATQPRSRGLLVLDLAVATSVAEIRARLSRLDLQAYPAFTLIALGLEAKAQVATWDGQRVLEHPAAAPPVSSSSFNTDAVVASRLALFRTFQPCADATPGRWLDAFHRSHLPAPGAFSVCMHRPDARTVSYSRLRVSARLAQFHYHPAAPCEQAPAVTHELVLASGVAS